MKQHFCNYAQESKILINLKKIHDGITYEIFFYFYNKWNFMSVEARLSFEKREKKFIAIVTHDELLNKLCNANDFFWNNFKM
jgi:hypothetical protein